MKAVAAAIATLMRFICSCFSALFGDFRLSAYDPVMQLIPPGELYSDIAAVALFAFLSRLMIGGRSSRASHATSSNLKPRPLLLTPPPSPPLPLPSPSLPPSATPHNPPPPLQFISPNKFRCTKHDKKAPELTAAQDRALLPALIKCNILRRTAPSTPRPSLPPPGACSWLVWFRLGSTPTVGV